MSIRTVAHSAFVLTIPYGSADPFALVVDEVSSAGELSPADDLSGPIFTSCSGRPKQSVEAGLYKLPRAAGLRQRIECAISAIFHYSAI